MAALISPAMLPDGTQWSSEVREILSSILVHKILGPGILRHTEWEETQKNVRYKPRFIFIFILVMKVMPAWRYEDL